MFKSGGVIYLGIMEKSNSVEVRGYYLTNKELDLLKSNLYTVFT